jgi:hypothetical protein
MTETRPAPSHPALTEQRLGLLRQMLVIRRFDEEDYPLLGTLAETVAFLTSPA